MKVSELTEGCKIKDKSGNYFIVVKINSWDKVDCKYINTGYEVCTQKSNAIRGSLRDRLAPNHLGAFIGVGKYTEQSRCCGNLVYSVWRNMISRCLDVKNKAYKKYGGIGVSICKDWMNYQVFAEWYFDNYPSDGNRYQLDKDYFGQKTYSPNTCKFLTAKQNTILANAKSYRIEYADGSFEEVLSLADYAARTGRSQSVLSRIASGEFKKRQQNKDILNIVEIAA